MNLFLGYKDVYNAYDKIIKSGLMVTMWSVAVIISIVLIFIEVVKRYRNSIDRTSGIPDMRAFFDLLTPLALYMFIAIAFPVIMTAIEKLLSLMEAELLHQTGHDKNTGMLGYKVLVKEWEDIGKNDASNMGIFGISNFIGVTIVKPFLYAAEQWIYSISLTGRFFYLILLQLAAPIAIIGLINQKTSEWFFIWIKNMFACYLLLPAFMIANVFAEALKMFFFTNGIYSNSTLSLLFAFCIKLYLFNLARTQVFRLI